MIRKLWLKWKYRGESKTELMQLLDLSIKAGRRVNHDLAHCISDLGMAYYQMERAGLDTGWKTIDIYRDRQDMWSKVFYPLGGIKNYRTEMMMEQLRLQCEINRLKDLCIKHGIEPENPLDIPF